MGVENQFLSPSFPSGAERTGRRKKTGNGCSGNSFGAGGGEGSSFCRFSGILEKWKRTDEKEGSREYVKQCAGKGIPIGHSLVGKRCGSPESCFVAGKLPSRNP